MVSRVVLYVLAIAVLAWLSISQKEFLFVNDQATNALRQWEGERLSVVARYYPGAADDAETALRKSFVNAHSNFVSLIQAQFHGQAPDATVTDEFLQSVIDSPGLDKSFPLNLQLAGLWARGQSGEAFLNGLTSHVHEAMQQYILPAQVPDDWKTGAGAWLVALTNADAAPTPQFVEENGFRVSRSNIVSFTRARTHFRAGFDEKDRAWANYAVQFLKDNCAPDLKLTEAVRATRMTARRMSELAAVGAEPTPQKPVMAAVAPVVPVSTVVVESNNGLVWFVLGAVSLLAVLAIALVWRIHQRAVVSLLPARIDAGEGFLSAPAGTGSRDFRELVAPHLARLLTNKLVRKLISQRSDLLMVQQQVTKEIEELERRLEQMHAPLQERLGAYEKRIHELEAQLAAQTEQNRELIKAKIEGVKHQMESSRATNRLNFN